MDLYKVAEYDLLFAILATLNNSPEWSIVFAAYSSTFIFCVALVVDLINTIRILTK